MTTLVFDTHALVKKLEAAGFTERQAEVLAETQTKLLNDHLATKQDIELLRAELKQALAETKADLVRWTIGAGIFQTALIAALLLKLVH